VAQDGAVARGASGNDEVCIMIWAPLALTAATTAMLAAPLTPALLELHRRRDAAPLPTRADDGRVTNFALAFANRIAPLMPLIEQCADRGDNQRVALPDSTTALLIGSTNFAGVSVADATAVILCAPASFIPQQTTIATDVYAAGDLYVGNDCKLRAVYAAGDASFGTGTVTFRWAHARGAITLAENSAAYGRLSSGTLLRLERGSRFERVNAPIVLVGLDAVPSCLACESQYGKRSSMDVKMGRVLTHGDFHLACGDVLQGHVISYGRVSIESGSRILGSVKSHSAAYIGNDTEIDGAVVSAGRLHIAGGSRIRGPILAENAVFIGPNTQIGSADVPTTVSAPRIRITPGSVIYGTLWARNEGRVDAS
jgi:predicted acyltransferase (DUF342 family)